MYKHFKKELGALKLNKISANVSYYDILTESTSVIEDCLNKDDLENIKYSNAVDEFPFHAEIFALLLDKIKEIKMLIETSDERYPLSVRI